MYPGPFSMTHNYGYKPVASGLRDWYDPRRFLAHWIQRTKPLMPSLRPLDPALRASFLSLESLAGRLGFGLLLLWLGWLAGPNSVGDAPVILDMLRASAWVAAVGLLGLIVTRRAIEGPSDVPSA